MGGTLQTLTIDEIVEINRRMVAEFGGIFFSADDNLLNPGSLDHVLDEIQGSLFGQELHPSIYEKAATVGWRIIAGHVFHDGNKRTGIESCRLLLDLNGYEMRIDMDVVETALKVANGEMQLPDFAQWVEQRTTKKE